MHLKNTLQKKSARLAKLQAVELDKRRKQLTPEEVAEMAALKEEVEQLQNTIAMRGKIQGAFSSFPFGGGAGLQYRGPEDDCIHEEQIIFNLEKLTEILSRVGDRYNAMEREIHEFNRDAAAVGRLFARIMPGIAETLNKNLPVAVSSFADEKGTATFTGLNPSTRYELVEVK